MREEEDERRVSRRDKEELWEGMRPKEKHQHCLHAAHSPPASMPSTNKYHLLNKSLTNAVPMFAVLLMAKMLSYNKFMLLTV